MVWRKSYQTKLLADLPLPATKIHSINGFELRMDNVQIIVGGFGFNAIADQGVWWRLFQSDFANDDRILKGFIVESVDSFAQRESASLVPPSEHSRCVLIEDPIHAWQDLIKPDRENVGFAAVIVGSEIPILMIGPPTEEAWEDFSNYWMTKTLSSVVSPEP
jgi:hypothetical protein